MAWQPVVMADKVMATTTSSGSYVLASDELIADELLANAGADPTLDSWVDLYYAASHPSTPPLLPASQIEKLLLEAQRESNQSSLKNSGYCSPRTPKSLASNLSVHDDMLPHKDADPSEWIWDWSGRPESSVSARDLKYGGQSGKASLSLRHSRVIRKGVISEMLPLFVFSNLLSIILGAGIGLFFGKRWSAARNLSVIGLD